VILFVTFFCSFFYFFRYLDESLIPNDPDEDLSMFEANEIIPFHELAGNKENVDANNLEMIPWSIPGQEEEDRELLMDTTSSFDKGSNGMMMMGNMMSNNPNDLMMMGGGMGGVGVGNMNNMMMGGGMGAMGGMGGNMMGMNMNNGNMMGGAGISEFEMNSFINSLPLAIQSLDPFTLQMIMSDPSILQFLILSDGMTVNEENLMILRNCSSLEDFYNTMNEIIMSTATGNNGNMMNNMNMMMMGGGMQQQLQQQLPTRSSRWERSSNTLDNFIQSNNNPVMNSNNMGGWGNKNPMLAAMMMNKQQQSQMPFSMMGPSASLLEGMMTNNWNNNDFMMNSMDESGLPLPLQAPSGTTHHSRHRSSSSAAAGGREPSKLSAVPCRFFNSPKGCINGDKCKFGHFADGPMGGGPGMGMGMGNALGAPGISGPGQRCVYDFFLRLFFTCFC
jgi:hypothetical protein